MAKYRISGVPIAKEGKLVGILTNRDLKFETNYNQPIGNIMTWKNLVTAPVGTTLEEAKEILGEHRIEKLPIVDADFNLKGLITIKDIEKPFSIPTPQRTRAADCLRERRSASRTTRWKGLKNSSETKLT